MRPVRSADSLRPYSADFRAGLWAGLIAGLVDEAVLIALALLQGASPWAGMKGAAAMALGAGALQAPDGFQLSIVAAALAVHFALSIVYGLIGAALMRGTPATLSVAIGVLFGLALYAVNYFVLAPLYFAWLVPARGMPIVIAAHVLFGLVLAIAYAALRHVERRSGHERRVLAGQAEPGRRRLPDRRREALAYA